MQCQGAGRLGALRRAEGTGSQWCTDKRGRENMKCDVCQWTRCKVGHLQSWQRCGTTGMCAPCWWEANLVQLLQRQGNAHAMFPMGIYSGETHARAPWSTPGRATPTTAPGGSGPGPSVLLTDNTHSDDMHMRSLHTVAGTDPTHTGTEYMRDSIFTEF